jgi:hypothetical protein
LFYLVAAQLLDRIRKTATLPPVIISGDYRNVEELTNPVNDAQDIAAGLYGAGILHSEKTGPLTPFFGFGKMNPGQDSMTNCTKMQHNWQHGIQKAVIFHVLAYIRIIG